MTEMHTPPPTRIISTWLNRKPAANSLLVAATTILVMTLTSQVYWQNLWGLSEFLPAIPEKVFTSGQWWRIYTAVFIHADFKHFLSNMYMLSIFGFFVYGYFGKMLYPLLAVAISGPVNALALMTYEPDVHLLGASGLVYVLGGVWLTLFVFLQRQYHVASRFIRAIGMSLVVLFPSTFEPSVSYRTHLFGFIAGIILGVGFYFTSAHRLHAYEVHKPIEPEADDAPTSHRPD